MNTNRGWVSILWSGALAQRTRLKCFYRLACSPPWTRCSAWQACKVGTVSGSWAVRIGRKVTPRQSRAGASHVYCHPCSWPRCCWASHGPRDRKRAATGVWSLDIWSCSACPLFGFESTQFSEESPPLGPSFYGWMEAARQSVRNTVELASCPTKSKTGLESTLRYLRPYKQECTSHKIYSKAVFLAQLSTWWLNT